MIISVAEVGRPELLLSHVFTRSRIIEVFYLLDESNLVLLIDVARSHLGIRF